MTYTKADLQRIAHAADVVWSRRRPRSLNESADSYRDRVLIPLRYTHGVPLIRAQLRAVAAHTPASRETRAAARLERRIASEGLPAAFKAPWWQDEHEHVQAAAQARSEERESARLAEERQDAEAHELELARLERARIEAEISRTVEEARVAVCFADSPVFGEAPSWDELGELVTPWAVWARPAAQAVGVGRVWAKTAEQGQGVAQFEPEMQRVWQHACETLTLPAVLDLRGTPHSAGILAEAWRESLRQALEREGRGAVLIVAEGAGALARLL